MADELVVAEGAATPISLYLDLENGQKADLVVVARAALAWAAYLKEVAAHLDPFIEIRIEIASGTPGSFSLDSIIKAIKKATDEPVTLGALLLVAALWFGGQVAEKGFDGVWHEVFGADEVQLSPAQMQELSDRIANAIESQAAQNQAKQVYRELERDPVIRGVGVTPNPGQRPSAIIPRAEFQARAGREVAETAPRERTTTADMWVTLVSPVLLTEARRGWRFRGPTGEFSAPIKDRDFVDRTLSGASPIPMVAGIELEVELGTKEVFRNGVWVPTERSVERVLNHRRPPQTTDLFAPQTNDDKAPGT